MYKLERVVHVKPAPLLIFYRLCRLNGVRLEGSVPSLSLLGIKHIKASLNVGGHFQKLLDKPPVKLRKNVFILFHTPCGSNIHSFKKIKFHQQKSKEKATAEATLIAYQVI